MGFNIKVVSDKFGDLINETFMDQTQFKIFLKMVHGCLELKNDLTFFNGVDFLVHVPYKYLAESIVLTSIDTFTLADHAKSKIEALITK